MDLEPRDRRLVICFPPAGGSEISFLEIFRECEDLHPRKMTYPGKGVAMASWAAAVAASVNRATEEGAPLLLGADLGALAAFETAQFMQEQGFPPAGVVLLSSAAPHCHTWWHGSVWTDARLLELLHAGKGGAGVSFGSPAERERCLAAVRRDLEWVSGYRGPRHIPLVCPLTALRGEYDALVPGLAGTRDWSMWARGDFATNTIPAGSHHFFTEPKGAAMVRDALRLTAPTAAA